MSTSIEQRVVQMRFDNKQFEKGVAQSMSTLDKLKEKLHFKNAGKDLEELNRAAQKVDLSPVSDSADEVGLRFDALAVVAATALSRITNAAISTGKNMVKALTLEPVMTGFKEYELKMDSVQTIMSNTASKGTTMKEITDTLDELNHYADKTIYNFAEMTRSIGLFTAAGVDLETSAAAIQGISNLAASVGTNATDTARVMYQLSQALSTGSVKLQDWRSLESAGGMAGEKFQEALKSTAREMGIAVDAMIEKSGNFRESLSKGWLSTEVLNTTLNKFTVEGARNYAQSMMEMGKYTQEQADALVAEAQAMEDAATKVKTFSQLWGTLQEAAQSGWAQTWEILVGDFEEAKELLTNVSDTIGALIGASADARNEMLQGWKDMGGRSVAIDALAKAFNNLMKIATALKSALDDIFPPMTSKRLYDITVAVKDFIYSLELSDEAVNTLRVAAKALLLPFKAIAAAIEIGVYWAGKAAKAIFGLIDALVALPSKLGTAADPLRKLFGDERYNKVAHALMTIVEGIGSAFGKLGTKLKEVVGSFGEFGSFADVIERVKTALEPLANWILDGIVAAIETLANADYGKIFDWAITGIDNLKLGFNGLSTILQNGVDGVKDFFAQFNIKSPADILKGITGALNSFVQGVWDFVKSMGGEKVINGISNAASRFAGVLYNLASAVKSVLDTLTPGKILVFSFGAALTYTVKMIGDAFGSFGEIAESVTGMFKSLGGVFNALKERIQPSFMEKASKSVIQFAAALTIMAGALFIVSKIDGDRLWVSFGALSALLGVFVAFSGIMIGLSKAAAGTPEMAKNFMTFSSSILIIGAAVTMLAGALLMVSKINTEGIASKLLIMGGAIATLIGASIIVGKYAKDLSQSAIFIIAFAGSMMLIARSLQLLSEVDLTGSIANVTIVLAVMAALAGVSRIMTRTTKEIGDGTKITSKMQGLTGMILSLVLLVGVLKLLSGMDTASLVAGLINMIPVFAALLAIVGIVRLAGKSSAKIGSQVLSMSAAILLLSFGIERIGSIDKGIVDTAMGVIGKLIFFFGFITVLSQIGQSNGVKMGSTFMGMAVAISILGLAIGYIGKLSLKEATQGTIVVGVLMALFGALMVASRMATGAKGTITAMTVALGLLVASLALLTLLDFNELMGASAALGLVLIALGVAFSGIGKMKMSSAMGSILVLLATVSMLGLVFKYLQDTNPQAILASATGIGEVLIALGVSMSLLRRERGKNDVALATVITMGLILAELSGLMLALTLMPAGENLIAKATAMSEIIVALSGAMILLGVAKDPGNVTQSLITMAGMLAGATIVVWRLSALPADDSIIKKATALSIILVAMSGVMAIISAIGTGLSTLGSVAGPALVGAVAAEAIILSLIALIEIIGLAFEKFDALDSFLTKAEDVLPRIGLVIGEFIGNIIGGVLGGIAGGTLEALGTSLSNFADNVQDFLALKVDPETVESIERLAAIAVLMTGAEFLESILRFGRDSSLEAFGKQLADFGPHFATFASSISGIPTDAVNASATCLEALSNVLANIPTDGGLLGEIFGNKDISAFGAGLSSLAAGIASYALTLQAANISNDTVEKTNKLTRTLIDLANGVPKTGGLVKFLGEHNIGTFGEQLAAFGTSLSSFIATINGIVIIDSQIEGVNTAATMLVNLANKVPKTGALVSFLGGHDIGAFGDQLTIFGEGLKKFFNSIKYVVVDEEKAKAVKAAGDSLVSLAETVPKSGALLTFFGAHDIGAFGDQIAAFGRGLGTFFYEVNNAGVDQNKIDLAKNAGIAFTEIADALGTNTGLATLFENTSLETFGKEIKGLGTGIADYYTEISGVAWETVTKSIDEINRIIELGPKMAAVDSKTISTFDNFLTSLANTGVEKFTTAFSDSESQITDTVYSTINNALAGVKPQMAMSETYDILIDCITAGANANLGEITTTAQDICLRFAETIHEQAGFIEECGRFFIASLIAGIAQKQNDLSIYIQTLAGKMIKALHDELGIKGGYSKKFEDAGKACIDGLDKGFNSNQPRLIDRVKRLANTVLNTFDTVVGYHSPWETMVERGEAGSEGLAEGIENNADSPLKSVTELGETILEEYDNAFDMNGDTSGVMTDLGSDLDTSLGDGILDSDYAIDAAASKADQIVGVFQDRFKNISSALSILDKEFEVWAAANPTSAYSDGVNTMVFGQGAYNQKQMELLTNKMALQAERVNMANAQYQATVLKMGANSTEAMEAYDAFLDEQLSMIQMSSKVQELEIANQDNFRNYAQLLAEVHDDLKKQGFSEEEIRKSVSDQTGWVNTAGMTGIGQGIQGMVDAYAEQATSVESLLTEAMSSATTQASSNAKSSGTQTVQNYGTGATEAVNNGVLAPVADAITNAITPSADAVKKSFEGSAANGVEGVINWLSDFIDTGKAKATGQELGSQIVEGTDAGLDNHSPSKKMEQSGQWATEGLINGLSDSHLLSELYSTATNNADSTQKIFSDSAAQYPDIGINMMKGLAQGIASGQSTVIQAATNVATEALAAAQAALGIYSPSRKFFWIGEMIDQGLGNGIEDSYSIVDGSISKIVNRMEQISKEDYLMSIRPVIDDSSMRGESSSSSNNLPYRYLVWNRDLNELVPSQENLDEYYLRNGLKDGYNIVALPVDKETYRWMHNNYDDSTHQFTGKNADELTDLLNDLHDIATQQKNPGGDSTYYDAPSGSWTTAGEGVQITQNFNSPTPLNSAQIQRDTNTGMTQVKEQIKEASKK